VSACADTKPPVIARERSDRGNPSLKDRENKTGFNIGCTFGGLIHPDYLFLENNFFQVEYHEKSN